MSLFIFKSRVRKNDLVKILTSRLSSINAQPLSLVLPTKPAKWVLLAHGRDGKTEAPEPMGLSKKDTDSGKRKENLNPHLFSLQRCRS